MKKSAGKSRVDATPVLEAIVAEANLAPTVHNTQPTRWRADNGAIYLRLDPNRYLTVADPELRDARLSMGTAFYGTCVAAARHGFNIRGVEIDSKEIRLELCVNTNNVKEIWDRQTIARRMTWRQGYAATPRADLSALAERSDTTLSCESSVIDALAALNDSTSLEIMRGRAFRDELRQWMRLSKKHPDWLRDGMNTNALGMSSFESSAANLVLSTPVFELFDKLGMGGPITAESVKTRSSHWIIAFHRPEDEDPLTSGEAFYQLWLMLTAHGQAAWPMAALADDPGACAETRRLMGLPDGQRLINVLRVGPLPAETAVKARIPANELIDV